MLLCEKEKWKPLVGVWSNASSKRTFYSLCFTFLQEPSHKKLFSRSTSLYFGGFFEPEVPLDYKPLFWFCRRTSHPSVLHMRQLQPVFYDEYNITNKLCSIVVFAASKRENIGHRFREIFGILNIYCEVYTANIKVNYMIRLYRNGVT